jgi:hypothetical protein
LHSGREPGGEGADGVEDGEATGACASDERVGVGGGGGGVILVPARDLDLLDELLEALVVDEGALPLRDDAGLVLP